jgi:hypothetical protein
VAGQRCRAGALLDCAVVTEDEMQSPTWCSRILVWQHSLSTIGRDETKDMRQDEASENGVPAWGKSRELADFAKFRGGVGEWTRLLQPTDRVIDLLLPSTT